MTLTTHAVAGAAIASLMPAHPALGFAAGFASHFALDAIPHWDYPINSESIDPKIGAPMRFDAALLQDMISIGFDAALGISLSLVLFGGPTALLAALCGALGGIVPDFLQFIYTRFKHEPLLSLQRFHKYIHNDFRLRERGHHVVGIMSQIALVALIVLAARWL